MTSTNDNPSAVGQASDEDLREFYDSYNVRNAFTVEECGRIRAFYDEERSSESLVDLPSGQVKHDIRKGRVSPLDVGEPELRWIATRIIDVCRRMNHGHYGFAVDRVINPLQLTYYPLGGEYGWHMDIGTGPLRCRKLSFTVQLSAQEDYDGGEFETFMPPSIGIKEQGSLIIFPSFGVHRVKPVTRGERWALVGWIGGTPWR